MLSKKKNTFSKQGEPRDVSTAFFLAAAAIPFICLWLATRSASSHGDPSRRQSLSGRSDLPADYTGTFEGAARSSLAEASDEGRLSDWRQTKAGRSRVALRWSAAPDPLSGVIFGGCVLEDTPCDRHTNPNRRETRWVSITTPTCGRHNYLSAPSRSSSTFWSNWRNIIIIITGLFLQSSSREKLIVPESSWTLNQSAASAFRKLFPSKLVTIFHPGKTGGSGCKSLSFKVQCVDWIMALIY